MLLMVIEHFKDRSAAPIGERFGREGRMLFEGISYNGSWVDEKGSRCFQLMQAQDRQALESWIKGVKIVQRHTDLSSGMLEVLSRLHGKT